MRKNEKAITDARVATRWTAPDSAVMVTARVTPVEVVPD